MSEGVFERVEKKYRIDSVQRRALEKVLYEHGYAVDCYGRSAITSMYWDTDDSSLICRSLEKPPYKEKVRIRSYAPEAFRSADEAVFVELKKKYDGVVYKRRVKCSLGDACRMLSDAPSRRRDVWLSAALSAPGSAAGKREGAGGCCEGAGEARGMADGSREGSLECAERDEAARNAAGSAAQVMNEAELACFVERHPGLSPSVTTRCVREAWTLPSKGDAPACEQDASLKVGRTRGLHARIEDAPSSDPFRDDALATRVQAPGLPARARTRGLHARVEDGASAASAQDDASSVQGPGLRVTFDSCLMAHDERKDREPRRGDPCGGEQSCEWFPLIGEDESILEAKAEGSFPLWFAHSLGKLGIKPCSFSKCGTALTKIVECGDGVSVHQERKEGK